MADGREPPSQLRRVLRRQGATEASSIVERSGGQGATGVAQGKGRQGHPKYPRFVS